MRGVGLNQKLEKLRKNYLSNVKDTDRSNQAGSEIDFKVKIFDIFGHSRPFSPT